MKFLKIAVISFFLLVLAGVSACSLGQTSSPQSQVTAARGDIVVKVNGTGKTSYAEEAKLAFGTAGKIETLNIKEGDAVARGQVLARLETDTLALSLAQAKTVEAAAQSTLTQARMAQKQAEVAVGQAQMAVTQAEINVTQTEAAETQAEAALTSAQFALDRTQAVADIKDDIAEAEWQTRVAQMGLTQAHRFDQVNELEYWNQQILIYQADKIKHESKLAELLAEEEYAGITTYEIAGQKYDWSVIEDLKIKQQQIQIAQKSVELAKQTIDQTRQNVEQAKQNVELAKQNALKYTQDIAQAELALEQAARAVGVAVKQLESATITAPFDGIIADLEMKQADFIVAPGLSAGTPMYMVKPDSLEVSTEVDEIDIAGVQVGQKALITLDAVPDQPVEGKVDSISLLPIVKLQSSGVVVYEVKVGFAGVPPAWAKAGMSANVDIVTSEKKGVVLVPDKSIKKNSQGQKIVDVLRDQKVQEQPVEVGLTDGTRIEVIKGLDEGDIVLVGS